MKSKIKPTESQHSTLQYLRALDGIIQPDVENLIQTPGFRKKALPAGRAVVVNALPAGRVVVGKPLQRVQKHNEPQRRRHAIGLAHPMKEPVIHFSYSPIHTIESARSGIKFTDFKNIHNLMKLSNSKWAEIIGISERTMQNIIKEKRNLDQNKSEKLLAFLTLVEYALDVLGNEENFIEWFNYKSPSLNGKAPIEYVDTFQGVNMLREQLFKIETGNLI